MIDRPEFLFTEKYRPHKISDCILPNDLKIVFQKFVDDKAIPNLLLSGGSGVGKTTVARAMLDEINGDYIIINGSMNGNIDTLRNDIRNYAATVSFTSDRKYVILDEADYLNCFLGKQKIAVVQNGVATFESIEDVIDKEFDVVSYNFKSNSPEITPGSVISSGMKDVFEIEFEDGSKTWCTEDHPFFDDKGGEKFINSGDLFFINSIEVIDFINTRSSNESIRVSDKKTLKIKSIRSIGMHPVYDVTTGSINSNFMLDNGVIAHNCNSTQPALRNFMEEFSSNCGFILTCNFKNRIIAPLHSRCSVIDFKISGSEKAELATQFLKRTYTILEAEGIEYDKKVVAQLITKFFPDWRRVLNELQRHAATGKIDAGILAQVADVDLKDIIKYLKERDFTSMRKWVAQNNAMETNTLFRKLYESAYDYLKPESVPQLVLTLGDYQYKSAFVVDQEINIAACMTSIMADCQFK